MKGHGRCLCGAIRVSAENLSSSLGACHCTMCVKWGGGPWLGAEGGKEVTWQGEGNLAVFPSSEWAERGFCKACGTHLYYRLKGSGQYFLSAGLFDGVSGFRFDHEVFIDEKPDYYRFADQTRQMTGAEVFAAFAKKNAES